jgi:hypothetical protein
MPSEKVLRIKQQLDTDQYRIDPYLIADAMIRRAGLQNEVPVSRSERQNECSKPSNGPSAPAKMTAGGPSWTEPIQLRAAFSLGGL